jgi:SAM-dependent methyltransferase
MQYFRERIRDRLTDVPFQEEDVVVDLGSIPVPGLFFETAEAARGVQAPVRLMCPSGSKLFQLDIDLEPSAYQHYRSGKISGPRSTHAESTAERIGSRFGRDTRILEIGAGRGDLVSALHELGFTHLHVIDPSDSAVPQSQANVVRAEFPHEEFSWPYKFDLIIAEHFLEHSPDPVRVLRAMLENLSVNGEIWIEVPDIRKSALIAGGRNLSIIYALHSSYFDCDSLAQTAQRSGADVIEIESIEHYGRSILARLRHGGTQTTPDAIGKSSVAEMEHHLEWIGTTIQAVRSYFNDLQAFGRSIPAGTPCYGAAERCMSVMAALISGGFLPGDVFDSNEELHGLYPSTFTTPVLNLADHQGRLSDLVILAVGYAEEIVNQNSDYLMPDARIWIPGRGVLTASDVWGLQRGSPS